MPALLLAFLVAVATVCVPRTVVGATIVFEHSGVGSGTLGSRRFFELPFTITAVGNTSNRTIETGSDPSWPGFPIYHTPHELAAIAIAGLGEFVFFTPTETFVDSNGLVGFKRASLRGFDLFVGPYGVSELAGWAMLSGTTEVSGIGELDYWQATRYGSVDTKGGPLQFHNSSRTVPTRFRATIIPEPSTLVLCAIATLIAATQRTTIRLYKSVSFLPHWRRAGRK
ncbi:hypothetical protein I41_51460 [Lacipirellula limnantheis]|uniref:PEP-CTERM protein-sorting domain-containing protein n=1 Tax=Lacipirellula limnantheis TaxID=2528024 RepID=A0A517U5J3_9BACT|nr:hypothetical protein I41_51460 [Lacipirellula limnantheis]